MPNLSNTVTFLFAGDGSLASEGLSLFLQTKSNFKMVSECSDGASVIADIAEHSPEIAVIDSHLPDMDAEQIIEAVRKENQETRIIILGASADRDFAEHLLSAGADAYLVRNGPSRYLNDAIRCIQDGGKYLAPEITQDSSAAVDAATAADDRQAVVSLRHALDAQARTVERLEQAIERTQQAIELLQQKVDRLTNAPVEPSAAPAPEEGTRGRMLPALRSGLSQIAAAVTIGVMGFVLAGVLKPAPISPLAEYSSIGSEDALKAGSTGSLNLMGWETESTEKATALLRNQQYAAAEKLCRNLLKLNPANTPVSRVLASALFHQGKVEETADVVRSMAVPAPPVLRAPEPQFVFQN